MSPEDRSLLIDRYAAEFQRQVIALADAINLVARSVPSRRRRKLHVGLFGYSRSVGGVTLPRAISFTAALYSLGVPPELLGLSALTAEDLAFIRQAYLSFDEDISTALRFTNLESPFLPPEIRKAIDATGLSVEPSERHLEATAHIAEAIARGQSTELEESVLHAAYARRFLG